MLFSFYSLFGCRSYHEELYGDGDGQVLPTGGVVVDPFLDQDEDKDGGHRPHCRHGVYLVQHLEEIPVKLQKGGGSKKIMISCIPVHTISLNKERHQFQRDGIAT